MRFAPTLLALLVPAVAWSQALPSVWDLQTPKDAPATLVYGPPTTPVIGFACARKSGQILVRAQLVRSVADHRVGEAWVDAAGIAGPWPASVTFASSPAASTLRGQAEAGPGGAGTAVTTEISTAAPVIQAFGKTGVISLTALSETVAPAVAKPGTVRKFLGVCR